MDKSEGIINRVINKHINETEPKRTIVIMAELKATYNITVDEEVIQKRIENL